MVPAPVSMPLPATAGAADVQQPEEQDARERGSAGAVPLAAPQLTAWPELPTGVPAYPVRPAQPPVPPPLVSLAGNPPSAKPGSGTAAAEASFASGALSSSVGGAAVSAGDQP